MTFDELVARSDSGIGPGSFDESRCVVVDLDGARPEDGRHPLRVGSWPVVLIGVGPAQLHHSIGSSFDVVVQADDPLLPAVLQHCAQHHRVAVTLAMLLRGSSTMAPIDALVAESIAYSMLQGGPDFASWSHARAPRTGQVHDETDVLRIERTDDGSTIVLNRPSRHNAMDRRLRRELHDALRAADIDGSPRIVLMGDGPSFSSGGDLDEFGSFTDPADAHLVRMTDHPATASLDIGAQRLHAFVHGACMGGGLELAAFCGHVTAAPGTRFRLPEIELGLIPGAGGTVSITRRIGRQRMALLALSAAEIDAATALDWGLVDAVSSAGSSGWPATRVPA
ncbi:MAG: hypothetical protein JWN99_63 [Ilumatobacteraceae bacterium]|nr:hypothetical protein [Ilumatobacteraceae bacterium]